MASVLDLFIDDCYDAEKIIGFNIYFDTSIIKANFRREFGLFDHIIDFTNLALDTSKRTDLMMKTIKFVGAKQEGKNTPKFPSLVDLHIKLFGETFNAHNALEDVKATKRCYEELIRLKII